MRHWDVASQNTDGNRYWVSFEFEHSTCECAYHTTGKECGCKHIAAVEHLLLISSEAALGKKISVEEHELKCPTCKKKKFVRDGWYRGEYEDMQRYSAPYANGGSETIWALSTVTYRVCSSHWP